MSSEVGLVASSVMSYMVGAIFGQCLCVCCQILGAKRLLYQVPRFIKGMTSDPEYQVLGSIYG